MAQTYEQYMYKAVDNFDLSLNITEANLNNHNTGYMSVDQTFHTPSFGDEEFDIPPINFHHTGDGSCAQTTEMYNRQHVSTHQNQQMAIVPQGGSPQNRMIDPSYQGSGGQPEIYMTQMGSQNNMHMTEGYNIQQQQQQRPHYMTSMEQQDLQCLPPHSHPCQPLLTTISHSQLSSQLGLQIGMGRPQGGSISNSPPGSNHTSPGLETSEDSDDSAPLSQFVAGVTVKRPSPEPVDHGTTIKTTAPKKPKPQKKKKKRDPNEPQKPVSAYALFFRDRQAAIKGQNPNASFGEVSKIVASMWDSLDTEHKNVYKKKTEAAKKEYLKALAAYRASLVSKQAAADQSDSMYGSITSPTNTISSGTSLSPDRGQSMSPIQKRSPLLTSLMDTSSPIITSVNAMSPPHTSVVTSQVWAMPNPITTAPTIVHQNPMVHTMMEMQSSPNITQVSSPPLMQPIVNQPQQLVQQQQQQNMNQHVSSPSYTQNVVHSPSPPQMPPGTNMTQMPVSHSPIQTCLRHGCTNPPIDSPDWDREYCSNECVVSHCRDVFTAWVASRQANNSYASVK